MLDVLIRGGLVVDGSGNPPRHADVGLLGDRIAAVGRLAEATAVRSVDARGKVVCPGLIDCHSHSDWSIHANPLALSTIRQGVTTEIVGNCGYGSAPLAGRARATVVNRLATHAFPGPCVWTSYAEYLDAIRALGTSCNLAFLAGHNTLREAAGITGANADPEQQSAMERFLREALEAGALGMSTGLEFEPGRLAPTAELEQLAVVLGEYDALYASHIRNRDAHLQEAIDEFVRVVAAGNSPGRSLRGEVSHLNVRYGSGAPEGAWENAVATVVCARARGLDVLADTTPYPDGIGQLAAILPPWVKAGGPARTAERLQDPEVRARLRGECDRYWRFIHRGEWHRVRLARNAAFPELSGLTFPEIAARRGVDEWECCFDILAAHGEGMDSLFVVGEIKADELLVAMATHPLYNLGSDGFTSTCEPGFAIPCAHPIHYAGMTHYFTHYVCDRGVLRLEEAVRKLTSMPADHFGLTDRGQLRRGCYADVVVLDLGALEEVSTVRAPEAYARGVEQVWVNGASVIADGEHLGTRPGRVLTRA
ncbi:MAG: amidohydrolase family protein [Chloroflexi bacterium]|nr:amidohydrolase family protein [Chloroflexota bacterium]